MKILYAGTPAFAVPPLQALLDVGHEIAAVITQRDKPVGRKAVIAPSPVKVFALERGLPVFQPQKIRLEAETLRSFGAEAMVTCAFGQILTQEILDLFPKGVWNIHASLLPAYRGAAPVQWCIIHGETHTGVTIMKTEAGLDTGDILLVRRTAIGETETAGELSARLSLLGARAIVEGMELISRGDTALLLQDNAKATMTKKIGKEQAKLDFSARGKDIVNLVRGMNPSPVAYAFLNGQPVNVYRASFLAYDGDEPCGTVLTAPKKLAVKCADGAVALEELQLAGGKRMGGADALNGRKIQRGQVLQ